MPNAPSQTQTQAEWAERQSLLFDGCFILFFYVAKRLCFPFNRWLHQLNSSLTILNAIINFSHHSSMTDSCALVTKFDYDMYLLLNRSGKWMLRSPQLPACSAWGTSIGLGCYFGSACSGLGWSPGGHKQVWTCTEHWWRRKPFQIQWRRVIQRRSGGLVSTLHNLTNVRLFSHLVSEHWCIGAGTK